MPKDEKIIEWQEELLESVRRGDIARALELKGWIEARTEQLIDDLRQ